MSNEQPQNPAAAASTSQPPPRPGRRRQFGNDSHLFDRLSVLYKYRWASITLFVLVVGWSMVDSYSQIPVYRATAQVLIEDPNADVATPTEIARSVTSSDPEVYMQTQLRIMRGRDLANRVAQQLHLENVPEFNGQGPKPTPHGGGHRDHQALRGHALPHRHLGRLAVGRRRARPAPRRATPPATPTRCSGGSRPSEVRGSQLVDMSFDSSDPAVRGRARSTRSPTSTSKRT